MFPHHPFKILDYLETYVVLLVAEIHEGAGVNSALRQENFDGTVEINLRLRLGLVT
jgi:hypothetical protein